MNALDRIIELTQSTLEEFDTPDFRLSSPMRKAIRIARLRNDYTNLWWLEEEMVSGDDKEARLRTTEEIKPHISASEYVVISNHRVDAYISERGVREIDERGDLVDKGNLCALSIPEIEAQVEFFTNEADAAVPPAGLHQVDLYYVSNALAQLRTKYRILAKEYQAILKRVEHRVYQFLSSTEKQLIYGQINSDIFEKNRRYVDAKLQEIAPKALEQFVAVNRRLSEGDEEARSQALLSCRRILKSIADNLYPASEDPVVDPDGKKRQVTDDKYINRLWQYVSDRVKGHTSGELLLAQINDLGSRIDRVYDLSSKGVHDNVPEFELNQCVIQTYLSIGDILRLADQDSAIYAESSEGEIPS